jgi:hypothetical protein
MSIPSCAAPTNARKNKRPMVINKFNEKMLHVGFTILVDIL